MQPIMQKRERRGGGEDGFVAQVFFPIENKINVKNVGRKKFV